MYSSEYETELRTDEEKVEWIKEHVEYFVGTNYEQEASDVGVQTSTWDLDDMLKEMDFEEFNVDTDYTYSNIFFTSKACDAHIRINRNNFVQHTLYEVIRVPINSYVCIACF